MTCECKSDFDRSNCNSDQWWDNDKCWFECNKRHVFEKDYVGNYTKYNSENGKYLAIIMDDSAIMFDEIIEETVPANLNESKANCKT